MHKKKFYVIINKSWKYAKIIDMLIFYVTNLIIQFELASDQVKHFKLWF
jgi:hypothetical protein